MYRCNSVNSIKSMLALVMVAMIYINVMYNYSPPSLIAKALDRPIHYNFRKSNNGSMSSPESMRYRSSNSLPSRIEMISPRTHSQIADSPVIKASDQISPIAADQISPNALGQLSPNGMNQIPPNAIDQIPPNAIEQIPPNAIEQISSKGANQIPPKEPDQNSPPKAISQISPKALDQASPKPIDPEANPIAIPQVLKERQVGTPLVKPVENALNFQQVLDASSTSLQELALKSAVPFQRPPGYEASAYNADNFLMDDGCDFSGAVRKFEPWKLNITCNNIHDMKITEKLGSGYWRRVFAGELGGKKLAVKFVRSDLMERSDILRRHVQEASVLYLLKDSPNIVPLIGMCNTTIVVQRQPQKLEDWVFDPSRELSPMTALQMALDMAKGVQQLHEAAGGPFVHADIQTRQFLIAEDGKVLLNDFNRLKYSGLSNIDGKTKCLFRTPIAKGKWRSPEEYDQRDLDEKLDIYSLALSIWTLLARVPPFEEYERNDVYRDVVEKNLRPSVEAVKAFPIEMQILIQEAWHALPEKRPSAAEVVKRITKILEQEKAKEKVKDESKLERETVKQQSKESNQSFVAITSAAASAPIYVMK